jgi:nucleoid-associated protein EbfC
MSAEKINNIAPRALGASVSGGTKMASIGAMGDLLKQAQEMQSRMAKIQEELANKTVQGSSGGGMVQVTVNGQLNITAVQIEPSVINSSEKEMLEDLILAAVNDGMRKARELASTEMSKLTGGLKIPGLMP